MCVHLQPKMIKENGMRRFFLRFCVLLTCVATLTSCLKDDEVDYSGYTDVAITQFTLGTLNRYVHTTSSKTGNDTTVVNTVTGSNYKMTIDHLNQRIYNVTPLPVGTDAKHVICTIGTKNGGVVALQLMAVKLVQSAKVFFCMLVMPLPMFNVVIFEQP